MNPQLERLQTLYEMVVGNAVSERMSEENQKIFDFTKKMYDNKINVRSYKIEWDGQKITSLFLNMAHASEKEVNITPVILNAPILLLISEKPVAGFSSIVNFVKYELSEERGYILLYTRSSTYLVTWGGFNLTELGWEYEKLT
ncbi:MAG: hypothetical protein GY828_04480 [Candidatus Gracilibacteria bacterium]|nr:hypothetical protein [Candidatus Gracilibacteria bacterium]